MGRKCVICNHEKRAAIELDILEGVQLSVLVGRYAVSLSSLKRHRAGHMNAEARQALSLFGQGALALSDPLSPAKEERLVQHVSAKDKLLNLEEKAQEIYTAAAAAGEDGLRTRLAAIAEMRNIVETMVKLSLIALELGGEGLKYTGPPWPKVKEALFEVCRKRPDAREDIIAAISKLEPSG